MHDQAINDYLLDKVSEERISLVVKQDDPKLGGGYKMIESLSIENFRCFETVKVHDLKRINVIVGKNSSGKTAFLESIFLAGGGSPEVAIRLRGWRLLGDVPIKDRYAFESLWRDLFYSFDLSRVITISFAGTPQNTQILRVSYNKPSDEVFIPFAKADEDSAVPLPINFETIDNEGNKFSAPMKITEKGLSVTIKPARMQVSYYASGLRPSPKEAADRLSELSKRNQERAVLQTIQRVFPFIESLSVETSGGDEYMIYAGVTSLPEKVPVSLISEGVYKLMSILLGIAATRGGIVLIDEIENGFYHETLPDIWRLLLEFAEQYRTQLFISTHSLEAIKHLLPTIEGDEGKFSLLRTEKENGHCYVRQFAGMQFKKAIEQRIDVR